MIAHINKFIYIFIDMRSATFNLVGLFARGDFARHPAYKLYYFYNFPYYIAWSHIMSILSQIVFFPS